MDPQPQVDGGGERRPAVDHGVLAEEDELAGDRDGDGRHPVPGRGFGAEGAGDQPASAQVGSRPGMSPRPSFSWARARSLEVKAAISDSSPASTTAPRISASRVTASPRRSGSGETPSTASASRWVSSAVPPDGRVNIMNRDVSVIAGGEVRTSQLPDRSALRTLLAEHFGFDLPEVETLRVPSVPEWA